MNEQQILNTMYAVVKISMEQLTDEEVRSLYLAVALEQNPKPVKGYGKVEELFTEKDGTEMSDITKQAFLMIAHKRLGL